MILDEAIKHAEEVADGHDIIKQIKAVTLEECKRAEEYRQLAEWLKDYKRMLNQELAKKSIEASEQPYDEFGFFDPFNVKDKEIEDAISRQAVLTLAKEECDTAIIPYRKFIKDVNALPPVTPAENEKVGRWVYNKNLSTCYSDVYTCSECGERCLGSCYERIEKLPDFCPKCHIKMEVEDEN